MPRSGIDPHMLQQLLSQGKGGGGDGMGDGLEGLFGRERERHTQGLGGGIDPSTDFSRHEANLAAASSFANTGMGPNTSLAQTFAGHDRAARAEAYNNRLKETEAKIKLLGEAEKAGYKLGPGGELTRESSGFETGYRSGTDADTDTGFNPQGEF